MLALVRHPVYGLVAYIAALFLSPAMRWWGQGPLIDVRWAVISAGVTLLAVLIGKKAKRPALPFLSHGIVVLLLLFVLWLAIQSFWPLDPLEHRDLLSYYVKFFVALFLIYRCVDSAENLRLVLWTYVLGCFYFGWIAFTTYSGGRFDDFGGAGIGEANAGALTLVTGIFAASALFLLGSVRTKAVLLLLMLFVVNGLVATISRSGFLAFAVGGIVFNYFTPQKFRRRVRVFSLLAVALFLLLAGPLYWQRINSIKYAGEEVQGIDTGAGRVALMEAQWRMFLDYPLGCGATCTAMLSPRYLEDRYLAAAGEKRERASHNTAMTMLVEHGIPGALFYAAMLFWIFKNLRSLAAVYRREDGPMPVLFPAIAAILVAITVGDMFVTYAKLEIRIWYIGMLIAMLNLSVAAHRVGTDEAAGETPAVANSRENLPVQSP